MSDYLVPIRTHIFHDHERPLAPPEDHKLVNEKDVVSTPEDALKILKSKPDLQQLEAVLEFLNNTQDGSFHVNVPGPLSAQLINALLERALPDFWGQLSNDKSLDAVKDDLVTCLSSVSGIAAIITKLRSLLPALEPSRGKGATWQLWALFEVLDRILSSENLAGRLWRDIQFTVVDHTKKILLWKEFLSLVASGRLIMTVAQIEDANSKTQNEVVTRSWISNGPEYARWLGANIANLAADLHHGQLAWTPVTQLISKSLALGYNEQIVDQLMDRMVLQDEVQLEAFQELVKSLRSHEQRNVFESILRIVHKRLLQQASAAFDIQDLKSTPTLIGGLAALLRKLVSENDVLKQSLVDMLITPSSSVPMTSVGLFRAAILAISDDADAIQTVMEKSLEKFGDQLYIKHTPIIQQEAIAQILLLSSAYLHRQNPMFLSIVARSSTHTKGISNRLSSSSKRSMWLGMVVAMALSSLVDKEDNRIKFDNEDMRTPEAQWYQQLIYVNDKTGTLSDLRNSGPSSNTRPAHLVERATTKSPQKPASRDAKPARTDISGPRIVELSETSDDDDLNPYSKPDSDPEDDDEDPTLVQRNKPRAPVYIRDLLAGLRNSENYDKFHLAISNAASLIARKADFGKEVTDHSEELAGVLLGLNDPFEIADFEELRQQALVALLVADPATIAQFIVRNFFEGDFSLQQRTAMLATLGLGARELAGFDSDGKDAAKSFPSKQLPPHLHKVFAEAESKPLDRVALRLEREVLQPLALEAADQLTGPNVLKVRTFSSRMAVEKARKKPIANQFAKIVAESFFFPLTGRWWLYRQAGGRQQSTFLSTHLLPTYIRTLAILLHAAGPSTLALPQMTAEFWDLLLSVRGGALANNVVGVLEAVLFAFMVLLDVNEDKQRLAAEHARELVETQEWARLVLDRLAGGDEQTERIRSLAAAVVMRCHEVAEKWQRLLLGSVMDI